MISFQQIHADYDHISNSKQRNFIVGFSLTKIHIYFLNILSLDWCAIDDVESITNFKFNSLHKPFWQHRHISLRINEKASLVQDSWINKRGDWFSEGWHTAEMPFTVRFPLFSILEHICLHFNRTYYDASTHPGLTRLLDFQYYETNFLWIVDGDKGCYFTSVATPRSLSIFFLLSCQCRDLCVHGGGIIFNNKLKSFTVNLVLNFLLNLAVNLWQLTKTAATWLPWYS